MNEWKEMAKPEIMKRLQRYCIAFILVEYPEDAEQRSEDIKFIGGSAFLWQTVGSKFIVTAHHVWEEFRNRIKKKPNHHLIFYLDQDHAIPIFDIIIISENKDLDLVVLGGSGIENLNLKDKAFFQQPIMPPTDVLSGNPLAILGYPKDLRISEMPYNTIGIVYMQGTAIVSESGLKIRMAGNTPNKFRSAAVPSLENFEMPGASGGPVFAFRESGIEWIGIVSEGGIAPYFDIVITPCKFINTEGKIEPPVL